MNTVLFDLDGTLLPMDLDEFVKKYFGLLSQFLIDKKMDADAILKGVMAGTKQMVENDGAQTNANLFWSVFEKVSGYSEKELESSFLEFYANGFQLIEQTCSKSKAMIKAVATLKDKGYRLLCATNPIFPSVASASRLRWSGVDTDAFEEVTTFENYHHCKPNVKYYEEILDKFNIKPEECMMVGNDAKEDTAIKKLGIPVYLVDDHLIKREDDVIESDWISNADGFLTFVEGLEDVKKR